MTPLNFGFLATGRIAHKLARTLQRTPNCRLVAAASRTAESAEKFAAEFGVEGIAGYAGLLERDDIEAIYIATPHPQHFEWSLRAIEAGKHVLCEKPSTMTVAEIEALAEAAKKHGVLLVEAFMYRFHPQTDLLVQLVREGTIGSVQMIEADFGFTADYDPGSRLFSRELGGGGILDVGCYPVSMSRLIAGASCGQPFLDPIGLQGIARIDEDLGTDWMAAAILHFPNNILATARCALRCDLGKRLKIVGTQGSIELNQPFHAGASDATITVRGGQETRIIDTASELDLYTPMFEQFAASARAGQIESPKMSHADSIGNLRALNEWLRQSGVVY